MLFVASLAVVVNRKALNNTDEMSTHKPETNALKLALAFISKTSFIDNFICPTLEINFLKYNTHKAVILYISQKLLFVI